MKNGSSLPDFTGAVLGLSWSNSVSLSIAKQGKGNSRGLIYVRPNTLAPSLLFLVCIIPDGMTQRCPPALNAAHLPHRTGLFAAQPQRGRAHAYNVCWVLISSPAAYLAGISGTRDLLPVVYLPLSPGLQ